MPISENYIDANKIPTWLFDFPLGEIFSVPTTSFTYSIYTAYLSYTFFEHHSQ
jgi:hypothetical protein